ncbi:putative transposase [Nocardia farcinica IFM 10152]|uniref:Putative transposase n=1 Tax=Nocardia farcinica (strain IFM 10152) TaxID=247156 RepID=Q5YQB3_NOCFA|nr:putative transposase [Nocardia farcinica IFM 10152]
MTTLAVTARADLSDAQWARLEPLLPTPKRPGRPSRWTRRRLLDGIRWRIRVGCPWRDIPPQYGSWQAIYALFRRWSRAGVWAHVLRQLQAIADAAEQIGWMVSVDSTIMRAHPHAAGGPPRWRPPGRTTRRLPQRTGRSRARAVEGRMGNQTPSGLRTPPASVVVAAHRRSSR